MLGASDRSGSARPAGTGAARRREGRVSPGGAPQVNWRARIVGAAAINPRMKQLLAISAIGSDRTGMVHDVTHVIADCGGNIVESRMSALGGEFVMAVLVSGNWHALAKIETEIKKLAESSELTVQQKRTEQRAARNDQLPYSVDIV